MDLSPSHQGLSFSNLSDDPENTILPEPDFKVCYFGHLLHTPKRIQKLKDFCLLYPNNGHLVFLLGMIYEYGLLEEPDFEQAKTSYLMAAHQLKNSPACYRLYFVYRQMGKDRHTRTLGITPNEELAYYYLIRAGAYANEMDNRISFKILDPIMHLYYYCEKFDREYIKAFYLFNKMKNILSAVYEPNYEYVVAWFQAKYPKSESDKKDSKLIMQDLAEQGHPEASCYLGESYRFFEEDGEGDTEKAAKYFEAAAKAGLLRAKEALIFIYLDTREIEKSLRYVYEAASEGSSVGIKFLGEFCLLNQYLPYDEKKGLEHLKLAFLLADFWALFSLCIYSREKLKKDSDIIPSEPDSEEPIEKKREKWEKKVFEYSEILYNCRETIGPIVHSTIRYGNIAECYEKGIYVKKDLAHAITYYEDFLSTYVREKKLAYIYYRMGVLYHKMNSQQKAAEFFSKAFKARSQFIKSDSRKETLHYYNYAKMLENGLGVKANTELAKVYYKKGTEEIPITFFTKLYFFKCKRRYEQLIKQEAKSFKILNNNKNIQPDQKQFKLKLIDPQEIMLVSERKVIGQPDIETLGGIVGSLENLSVPLKLSRVVKIMDISFQNYTKLTAELWKMFSELKEIEIKGVKIPEVQGIGLLRKEMSQLVVGDEIAPSKTLTEEGQKWIYEDDIDDIAEKFVSFVEAIYERGWTFKIFSMETLKYDTNKKELTVDYMPIIVGLYNNVKDCKERVPTMRECMISLLVYLKEHRHVEQSSMWKHDHSEKETLEESSIVLIVDPIKIFGRKVQEYCRSPEENILALLEEIELKEDTKKRIWNHLGF